jgi:hypothetical protein
MIVTEKKIALNLEIKTMNRNKGRYKLTLDIQNMLILLSFISLSMIFEKLIMNLDCLTYH